LDAHTTNITEFLHANVEYQIHIKKMCFQLCIDANETDVI